MVQLDNIDLQILTALQNIGTSAPVFQAVGHLGIEPTELGDRLELLALKRLVQAEGVGGAFISGMDQREGLGGKFAFRMTLPNGIFKVGLTAEGRQFLRSLQ